MTPPRARRGSDPGAAPLAAAVLAAAAVCHGLLLRAPFIYDDRAFILSDPALVGRWPGWRALFGVTTEGGEFEPLVRLAHWTLHHFFGAAPFPYRLTSLLLHWAVVWLVWRLIRRRVPEPWIAAGAAALFAAYPGVVPVLAQSTFKKHLLAALFGLLALEAQDADSLPAAARAALGALLFGLAALSKENGLIFLPLAAVSAWSRPGGFKRADAWFLAAGTAAAAAYAGVRLTVLPRHYMPLMGGGLVWHLLSAGKILLWHLRELVLPVHLSLEHSLSPVTSFGPQAAGVLLGVGAWLAAGAFLARRDRIAAFGWAWVTLALAPFLNLIPFLNYSLVANRYDYFASAGAFLLLARLASPWLKPGAPGGGRRCAWAFGLPFLAFLALGARYAALFSSPVDLWREAERAAPLNPRVHAALGELYASWHDDAAAERELRLAVQLGPALPEPLVALSWREAEDGRPKEALELARRRLLLRDDSTGEANLGLLLVRAGRPREALPYLRRAAAMTPGPDAELALGQCLLALGRLDEARSALDAAAADPSLA
ncbi:MAG: tetratricopeptide repeat protein, partial [Elusimicrobia bacterium]|nr:tetratricopeptide repeat protein [Elusimicrobiota bacterium]